MLDLKLLRENPDAVRQALKNRGSTFDLEPLLRWDANRRSMLKEIEEQRHLLKQRSDEFGRQKAQGAAAPPA